MTSTPSRRAFLRGQVNETLRQRPPGAAAEMAFHDACQQCEDCVEACPEGIIGVDEKGLPFLDYTKGACTFCHACTDACSYDALSPEREFLWRGAVEPSCLSMNGVNCRTCEDHCDERAIGFQLQTGGRAQPVLDEDLCNGCGGCSLACPVGAISFKQIKPKTEARS
ncbi:ferredoxin-type protein NapF [Aliiroseovarius marinus]|uniref:ferredoxin-type protein NapF n=1 Tax=Aliiroseovarius marinus TaxID=2500159 RepID=UPI003D7DD8E7